MYFFLIKNFIFKICKNYNLTYTINVTCYNIHTLYYVKIYIPMKGQFSIGEQYKFIGKKSIIIQKNLFKYFYKYLNVSSIYRN